MQVRVTVDELHKILACWSTVTDTDLLRKYMSYYCLLLIAARNCTAHAYRVILDPLATGAIDAFLLGNKLVPTHTMDSTLSYLGIGVGKFQTLMMKFFQGNICPNVVYSKLFHGCVYSRSNDL